MTDDEQRLRWIKTIESLPGLGLSKNPLMRVWSYDEVSQYPEHVVLWKIARGLWPVRNFGRLGQSRLIEALRELDIPEPKEEPSGDDEYRIKITLTCRRGHAADFDMLAILLGRDIDEIAMYGASIIDRLSYWLDVLTDDLQTADLPALDAVLARVTRYRSRMRPPAPPEETTP